MTIQTQTIKSRTFDNVTAFNAWDVKGTVSLNTTPTERLESFVKEITAASGYPGVAGERYLTGDYVQALLVKHRVVVDTRSMNTPVVFQEQLSKLGNIVKAIEERLGE